MADVFSADVSELVIEAWTTIMISEKVTIAELQTAAMQVMKSRVYTKLPTPAELLDIIRPRVDNKAIADAQANIVLKAIREKGRDRKPEFDDPITAHIMSERWSWSGLCDGLKSDDAPFWRRDFVDAYCAKQDTSQVKRLPGPKETRQKQIEPPGPYTIKKERI